MRLWKRLLGTALCLCAAVCVMSVSVSAAGTVIPAVAWEQQTRSTEYGKPITTHGFQVTEWYTAKYDYTGTWYRCEDLNKKNPTAVGELVLEDSVPELYYIPNDLEAGVYYYYLEVTAKNKGTNTIVETNWSPVNTVTVKPSVPKVDKDWPTVGPLQCGQTLSESTITGGTMVNQYTNAKVEGTFAWKDGSRVLTTKDSKTGRFDIVLLPSDTKNYKPGSIRMSVRVAHVTDKEGTITTAPTCTNQGRRSFTCSGCGMTYSSRPIPALGHDYTVQQSDGDNHWKKCSRCDVTDTPKAHQWDEGEVTIPATCTATGEKTCTCTVCNRTKTETLAALEHNYGEPSYVWNGTSCTAERVCSRDGSHKETETATAAVTVTQNKDCVSDELSTYTASFQNTAFAEQTKGNVVTANKLGHTNGAAVREKEVPATCTANGSYDEVVYCTVCNAEVSREAKSTDALGHDLVHHEAKAATCTEIGWDAYDTCSRCDYTTYRESSALGHDFENGTWQSDGDHHWKKCSRCDVTDTKTAHQWDDGKITTPATCTAAGEKTYTCTVCSATRTETVSATGHSWSDAWMHDATHHWHDCENANCPVTENAEKSGYAEHAGGAANCTEKAVCASCGTAYGDLDANGHDWGTWAVTTPATTSTEGVETRVCQRDSTHTQTRAIPKLPANAYGISGKVITENDSRPVDGATVKLVLGNRQIALKETDSDGRYSFEKVAPGVYNLVAEKDGIIKTVKVEVISKDVTDSTITMPQGKTNSVVEVKSDDSAETVEAVVGNLEKLFEMPGEGKPFTSEDQNVVKDGGSVEIKLTVTKTDTGATSDAIKKQLSDKTKVGVRLELEVSKTVTETNGNSKTTPVTDTDVLLETMIRLPAALQGKDSYTVYRLHGADVHTLTTQENENGEYIAVSPDKTAITIYAKLYSEYVITYQERGGNSGTGETGGNGGNGGNSGNSGGHDDKDDGHTPPSVPAQPETNTGYRVCRRDDTCPIRPFADAAPTAWYHDGVHYCLENGLMRGVSGGKFLPDGITTRAQLITILWRLEGGPEAIDAVRFDDVAGGAWYTQAVRWAAGCGVVKGYDNGRFGPDDAVTREQMAMILYRFAGYKGYDVSIGGDTNILRFTDGAAVSGYAVPAMRWVCGSGLMTGIQRDGGMALAPRDTTTRAQTATLLTRFQSTFAKES